MDGRTRVISARDVRALLTMEDSVSVQEGVFRLNGEGKAWNGENAWIDQGDESIGFPLTGKMMSGGIEPAWRGMKLLSSRKGDPQARSRMQLLALFDATNLCPLALIEANYMGHVRTGAGAAVASKYLARRDAKVIGVVGSGATARFALWAHAAAGWKPETVLVCSRSSDRRAAYVREMEPLTGFRIEAVADPRELVEQSGILITGTGSTEPVIEGSWVAPGTHINAMGQRQELPPELFLKTVNVADELAIAMADGKLSVALKAGVITPIHAHAGLGDIVAGIRPGRVDDDQITVFDSSGLTIQDIAAGVHVFEKAREAGVGTMIEFFHDEALW